MTGQRHRELRQHHLVVFSHPNPSSFNARVCRAYVEELERHGHAVVLRDLYALKLDPVLRMDDFDGGPRGSVPDDVWVRLSYKSSGGITYKQLFKFQYAH